MTEMNLTDQAIKAHEQEIKGMMMEVKGMMAHMKGNTTSSSIVSKNVIRAATSNPLFQLCFRGSYN
jgi:hypothetical protein